MGISAQEVNKLRQATGAGMMDCKKALVESDGDFDKAIEFLRKKGQKVSASRSDRETTEGGVFVETLNGGKEGMLIAIGCETDFVAKNEDFQNLGKSVLAAAVAADAKDLESAKKAPMDGKTVEEVLVEAMGRIGEKIDIVAFVRLSGEAVVPYIHLGSKLGVLVSLKGVNGTDVVEVGKDVAMQIAAMNPVAVDKDDVDETTVKKEIEIGKEQALAEGKPENIVEKIAMGKLNKFFKDNTLLNQQFVKDPSKTVSQILNETNAGLTVEKFERVSIG